MSQVTILENTIQVTKQGFSYPDKPKLLDSMNTNFIRMLVIWVEYIKSGI